MSATEESLDAMPATEEPFEAMSATEESFKTMLSPSSWEELTSVALAWFKSEVPEVSAVGKALMLYILISDKPLKTNEPNLFPGQVAAVSGKQNSAGSSVEGLKTEVETTWLKSEDPLVRSAAAALLLYFFLNEPLFTDDFEEWKPIHEKFTDRIKAVSGKDAMTQVEGWFEQIKKAEREKETCRVEKPARIWELKDGSLQFPDWIKLIDQKKG